jgi:hypothetical protein
VETVLLLTLPILVGAIFLILSRRARMRNQAILASGGDPKHDFWLYALRARKYRLAAHLFFFGNLPPLEQRIGNALALGVVVFLGPALLFLLFLLAAT